MRDFFVALYELPRLLARGLGKLFRGFTGGHPDGGDVEQDKHACRADCDACRAARHVERTGHWRCPACQAVWIKGGHIRGDVMLDKWR